MTMRWSSCALAALAFMPAVAAAHGALAVGLPPDVAKAGVALGYSYNQANRDAAEARALKECLSNRDSPPATRALCRVIETFSRRCVAIALDPEDGTPGVGWAVDTPQKAAEESALARCQDTAGASRRAFCKVMLVHCDTQP